MKGRSISQNVINDQYQQFLDIDQNISIQSINKVIAHIRGIINQNDQINRAANDQKNIAMKARIKYSIQIKDFQAACSTEYILITGIKASQGYSFQNFLLIWYNQYPIKRNDINWNNCINIPIQ